MKDLFTSLSIMTQNAVDSALTYPSNCFFVEVTKCDGQFVDVKLATTGDKKYKECKKIPIIQSAYCSPIVMPGDKGVLINIHIDIGRLLEDRMISSNIMGQDYSIFLPLITKRQLKSKNNALTLTSADLKSKIELTNESLTSTLEKDIITEAKASYSVKANSMTLEAKEAYLLKCKTFTLEAQDAFKVKAKSLTMEASGADPIKIKNGAGGLKDVVDALFQCMDGLASGLTGPSSNPASYQGVKAGMQAKINQIVG